MSFLQDAFAEVLEWTGWFSNGWRWAFSESFREQKQDRWRDLPAPVVVLDATGSLLFWLAEIALLLWLVYLAVWT